MEETQCVVWWLQNMHCAVSADKRNERTWKRLGDKNECHGDRAEVVLNAKVGKIRGQRAILLDPSVDEGQVPRPTSTGSTASRPPAAIPMTRRLAVVTCVLTVTSQTVVFVRNKTIRKLLVRVVRTRGGQHRGFVMYPIPIQISISMSMSMSMPMPMQIQIPALKSCVKTKR